MLYGDDSFDPRLIVAQIVLIQVRGLTYRAHRITRKILYLSPGFLYLSPGFLRRILRFIVSKRLSPTIKKKMIVNRRIFRD